MNVHEVLEINPSLKASVGERIEERRLNWCISKEKLRREEAKLALQLKARNPELKATEINASVDSNDEIYMLRMDTIKEEAVYRGLQVDLKKLDDEFTSAKMLARVQISELGTLEGGFKKREGV